ncbi:SMI1/KNR4 family protein [Streptomyces gilvosporeus]|uniref:Knr4/Smi1-like domain-containing protein n=1 Tax=Streptomyces gilvosporeus TaxID=553510 RepID=A0A1V0U2C0_9ACTN|nr:SMI1/KNR4 family protein [Streptomyces gilvosporeus]ARF59072.1 hypothetical protein B1H19_37210 [Streptomyces gilvosporeus]
MSSQGTTAAARGRDGAGGWDAAAVRARLAEMARRDPRCERFGADRHRYRLGPPLAAADVDAFEARYGIPLPRDYRDFLTQVGGSGAGPDYGLFPLEGPCYGSPDEEEDDDYGWAADDEKAQDRRPGVLATPFPLTTAWRAGPGEPYDQAALVTGSLAIAERGCGEFVRIVVTGQDVTGRDVGRIWFADQVWFAMTPGPSFREWYLSWLESDAPARR